jgi:hypothetical protein
MILTHKTYYVMVGETLYSFIIPAGFEPYYMAACDTDTSVMDTSRVLSALVKYATALNDRVAQLVHEKISGSQDEASHSVASSPQDGEQTEMGTTTDEPAKPIPTLRESRIHCEECQYNDGGGLSKQCDQCSHDQMTMELAIEAGSMKWKLIAISQEAEISKLKEKIRLLEFNREHDTKQLLFDEVAKERDHLRAKLKAIRDFTLSVCKITAP